MEYKLFAVSFIITNSIRFKKMKWGFSPKINIMSFITKKTWSRQVDKIGLHIFFISQENEKHEICLKLT